MCCSQFGFGKHTDGHTHQDLLCHTFSQFYLGKCFLFFCQKLWHCEFQCCGLCVAFRKAILNKALIKCKISNAALYYIFYNILLVPCMERKMQCYEFVYSHNLTSMQLPATITAQNRAENISWSNTRHNRSLQHRAAEPASSHHSWCHFLAWLDVSTE